MKQYVGNMRVQTKIFASVKENDVTNDLNQFFAKLSHLDLKSIPGTATYNFRYRYVDTKFYTMNYVDRIVTCAAAIVEANFDINEVDNILHQMSYS